MVSPDAGISSRTDVFTDAAANLALSEGSRYLCGIPSRRPVVQRFGLGPESVIPFEHVLGMCVV